jgi:hypothetical protein
MTDETIIIPPEKSSTEIVVPEKKITEIIADEKKPVWKKVLMIFFIFILFVAVVAAGAFSYWKRFMMPPEPSKIEIKNFDDCVKAGNPVQESYPMRCIANNQSFVQELTADEKAALNPPTECKDYQITECPGTCAVCPPCVACSSLSCQAIDFCEGLGFEKNWYNEVLEP